MADIVNRFLKNMLVTVVFCQLIFSARPQLQTGDDGIGEWTDVLADDAVISPYFSSERRTKNKRSVGIETSKQKPKTSYTQYSRTKHSPSKASIAINLWKKQNAGLISKYLQSKGKADKNATVIPTDTSKQKPKTSYTQYSRPKHLPSRSRIASNRGQRLHGRLLSKYLQPAGKADKNATVIPIDTSKQKPKTLYTRYSRPKHLPFRSRIASNRGQRLHGRLLSKYLQPAGKADKNATVIPVDTSKQKPKTLYTRYSRPKHLPSRSRIASRRGTRLDGRLLSKYLQPAGKAAKNATVIPVDTSKQKPKTSYTQYSRTKHSPSKASIAINLWKKQNAGLIAKYLQSKGKADKNATVIPTDTSKHKPKTLSQYSRPTHSPFRSLIASNHGLRLHGGKSSKYLPSAGKAAKNATVIPIDTNKQKPKPSYTQYSRTTHSPSKASIAINHWKKQNAGLISKYLQSKGKADKNATAIPIDTSKHKPKTSYTQYSSRTTHSPSNASIAINRWKKQNAGLISKYLQSKGKADKNANVIPTVSTLTDDSSLSKKDENAPITNNTPEDKPVPSDSNKPLATVIDAQVALTNNDPCEPDPCQNGGTCRRGLSQNITYECACPLQYRGKYCHEVMTRCEVIGCQDVTDCVSTPAGAVCLCKGAEEGRLCQLDVSNQTQWEKLKMVMSEQTVYTVEIVIGSVLGILILLAVVLAIHCKRVNSKRAVMRKSYKEALDKGKDPEEPSSQLTDYQTVKKLSRVQSLSKQKEDEVTNENSKVNHELDHLLNSRTSLPNSRTSLLNSRTNFRPSATRLQPQVSPEQIDCEINRRASSLRSIGLNGPVLRNQSLNNRYLPTRSGHYKSGGCQTRQLSKPTVANSRRPVVIRPSQTQCKRKYSFVEKLQKKASQQTLNGRRRQSLVNADKRQQYDMSGDRDDRTSEPVYESISQYINNSARRSYFYDKSDNVYLNSNNQERTNTGISFESEQCSYNQEDLARRMGGIKKNLEILKSSISQRKDNTRTTNRCSKAWERNKGQGQVRYATQAMWSEPAVESSNSEDEIKVSDKILVVNMETDLNHGTQGNSKYSAYNKNSNTNTNYSYNEMFPSEIYYKNLNHFEKLEKGYSLNSCSSRVKPEYFNPASVYGHLYRENSESTHGYSNLGPTNLQGSLFLDKDEEGNQEFENKGGIHDYEDKNSRSKDVAENMLAHSDGSAGNIEQDKNGELRAAYTHEMLNTQTDRELDKFQQSHPASDNERFFRPGESEYYGILATTFTSSPCTDHTQYMYPQRINDRSYFAVGKAIQPSISSRGTLDSDQVRKQNYVNASDNKGQRVYYLSSELESCTLYDSQLPTDSQLAQKEPRGASRNDHQNIETNKNEYMCSSPTVLERDEIHQHSQSAVLENTPCTILSTPNSNDLNVNNVEDSTLVAGINASDAEIEF